jgi:hypothetical protein
LCWVAAHWIGARSRVRLAKGDDGLLELRRPALALPQDPKHIPQIALGRGPVERHALAGPFLERLAIGGDGLFELRRPTLAPPQDVKRVSQAVLVPGPVERHAFAGYQLKQPLASLDRQQQSTIVAEFVSLLIESACLPYQVADPLVLMRAVRRKLGSRTGEVRGGFAISQSGERDLAAPGWGLGRVDGEAVERTRLLGLDILEQSIRFGQLTCIDGILRIGF